MANIGFIGLGIMGAPMARHLQQAGHTVITSKHSSPPRQELVEGGLRVVDTPKAVAEAAETIILMLPDTPQVQDVLFSENGVAKGLSAGKLVIDMSSISPIETKEFAKKVRATGAEYVDAPVSGGEVGAKNASLSIMAGGSQESFDRALPLFQLMGKNITLVGDCGDGQVTKVANQIIVALTIEAVSEALVFASKAGADPARVRAALMGGFASSRILEVHGERMVKRTFDPGFRISLHQKDLNLALQGAKAIGVALPNTASTQELFNQCAAHGEAGLDHSGLVKALERMANHAVA
ncbi:2-hydroxy-3-oxopropionate reductase [Rhizobium sp. YJ-22]|uniref:2-hydroxy-3-oxopropionate reductase n=1 Tax=Rhizobium sp. YJ-22 TaxID=3037556 RepID=UPI0024125E7F|nr:2-hydroxy-3-oxopropionate reductase [Rhizobium sp. YJ-22]MDG3576680.1 2-hydroxy-3-oxopropionate reductase [Rhizobium sp. YJ-22]